jgi:hypothetical protein
LPFWGCSGCRLWSKLAVKRFSSVINGKFSIKKDQQEYFVVFTCNS